MLITILPSVVGRMTFERKVADSNPISGDLSSCILRSRGICEYPRRNPGEGVKLGGGIQEGHADENNVLPSPTVSVQLAKPGCKRTVKILQFSPPSPKFWSLMNLGLLAKILYDPAQWTCIDFLHRAAARG
jgi:hypothetical protein